MKKHFIIGTAGHVDHGKSTLIKALTGIETDRLKEEQKRGITIELGFAWLDLPDGGKAGIVDVPGHERFVHHMLAGAGGVDLALLVVAADEGVMPQTREHLEILKLLDIPRGMIVLTKTDLVEPDWLDLAEEDIRAAVQGSVFAEAPIFRVSAYTGAGIEELRQAIFAELARLPEKDVSLPFREAIDRVFTMGGFGTVITGTAISGKVTRGDTLMLYPSEKEVRVRTVQVHDEEQESAWAGQRTALNLAGVSREEVARGEVLAKPGSMDPSLLVEARVQVSQLSPFSLKTGSSVHFHYGSAETLARVRLYGEKELAAGESGLVRFSFESPIALKYGDPYVIRFLSPLMTIGGGHILDPAPQNLKIHEDEWPDAMRAAASKEPGERLLYAIDNASPHFLPVDMAFRRSGTDLLPEEGRKALLQGLEKDGKIYFLKDKVWLSTTFLNKLAQRCQQVLARFHEKEPFKSGMRREALRTSLLSDVRLDYSDRILEFLGERGTLLLKENGLVALPDFSLELSPEQIRAEDAIEATYKAAGLAPADASEIISQYPKKLVPEALISHLIDTGRLVRLDSELNLAAAVFAQAKEDAIALIREQGSLKLADFRDHLGTSRKFAIAILDALDRANITRLVGEERVLL